MNANFQARLKEFGAHLVEVKRRPKGSTSIAGFVVDFSKEVILFHRLEWDTFRLNGYTAICADDVSAYRCFNKATYWQHRAVKHFGLTPHRLANISVESWVNLLTSAAATFPLFTLHRERIDPSACWVGPLLDTTTKTFTIVDLTCSAEWLGPRRMKYSDVTRVDFGGGYETALAVTAPKRKSPKSSPF